MTFEPSGDLETPYVFEQIVVGGAVLTADYAEKIGADFYVKDAKASADVAKQVLGA